MSELIARTGSRKAKDFDFLAVLQADRVFSKLPASVQNDLAGRGRLERYTERTQLAELAETPQYIRYVISGSVDLTHTSRDGRIASLPILRGHWATWLGCFTPAPLDYEIWSSAAAIYATFPAEAVRRAVQDNADALISVIRHIGESTRFLIIWTLQSSILSADRRLATFLLLATEMASSPDIEIRRLRLSQEQFGQLGLGSRQRVGRMLRDLEERGLIEAGYGEVSILSRSGLQAFVDSEYV